MELPDPATLNGDWAARIGARAEQNMNCTATFYAVTKNAGSAPSMTPLFAPCPAEVVKLQAILGVNAAGDNVVRRDYRMRIPLSAYAEVIPQGTTVRIAGGDDPTLADLAFHVRSATNGSHAAVRTVECWTEVVAVPAVS